MTVASHTLNINCIEKVTGSLGHGALDPLDWFEQVARRNQVVTLT